MDDQLEGNTVDIGMTTPTPGIFTGEWNRDRPWWRDNYSTRPYASADCGFDAYEPAYLFSYHSLTRYHGRRWDQVESNLRSDWQHFEGRGQAKWESVKDAVRDAWENITSKK